MKLNSQSRRRERRVQKQLDWIAGTAGAMGVSACPEYRPVLSLNRNPRARTDRALNPPDLTALAEYRAQIERELARLERVQRRLLYSPPKEPAHVITANQKRRGKSISLI